MKKIIAIGVLAITITSVILYAKKHLQISTIPNEIKTYLQKLESDSWQALKAHGVDEAFCKNELERERHRMPAGGTLSNLSDETKKICLAVAADFNIDPSVINFISAQIDGPATTIDNTIKINELFFSHFSTATKKFLIGHELAHYLHGDCIMHGIIKYWGKFKESENFKCPYNMHRRFCEVRADLISAFKGSEYAAGYLEFAEYLEKEHKDYNAASHPKHKQRIALAQQSLGETLPALS